MYHFESLLGIWKTQCYLPLKITLKSRHSSSTLGIHTRFCMTTPSSLEIYNHTHESLSNQDMKFHRHSLHFAKQQSCQIIHSELIRNENNASCKNTLKNMKNPPWFLCHCAFGDWSEWIGHILWVVVGNTAGITGSSWPRLCSPLTCLQYFNHQGTITYFYQERLI